MSMRITRRATAVVVAAGALLLAALAAAPQASAATLYACVKKNGSAHIYAKKPKCRKHETKLSWNTEGAAGKNGLSGTNGKNGANGTNGTSGTNGQDLTSHTALPSKQSESGWYAVGGGTSTGGEIGEGISFSQPLAAPIAEEHAIYNKEEATSTHCPGVGQADPGFLCLYSGEELNINFAHTLNFPPYAPNSTGKFGFALYFAPTEPGSFADGSWTVTAP